MKEPQNQKKSSLKGRDVNSIDTLKGIATLQKTDESTRILWYSYLDDKNLIPVKMERMKEIQKLIQEGMILKDLMEEAAIIVKPTYTPILDYVNVVGQDNINRFQNKNKKKRKKKTL